MSTTTSPALPQPSLPNPPPYTRTFLLAMAKANGGYPEKLADLVPKFVSAIPKARLRGAMTPHTFTYSVAGPTSFVQKTNAHVLMYTSTPPFGRSYYVFEEKRWGFYD